MKNTFKVLALAVLLALPARAQLFTGTYTLTNTPANLATFTINGTAFTWVTNVSVPASQVLITNTVAGNASNMFYAIVNNPIAGMLSLIRNNNGVVAQGLSFTFAASSGWASLVLQTNGLTNSWAVTVPASNYPSTSVASNTFSLVVTGIDQVSSNAFSETATALSNYASLHQAQTLGNKTMTNSLDSGGTNLNGVISNAVGIGGALTVVSNGVVSNSVIANATGISGNIVAVTNGTFSNPITTNLINKGVGIISQGSGASSEQFGASTASGLFSVSLGDGTFATGDSSTALGANAAAQAVSSTAIGASATIDPGATNGIAIGPGSQANKTNAIAVGVSAVASGGNSTAVGTQASVGSSHTNSTAIGAGAATTAANQVMLGSATVSTVVSSSLAVGNGATFGGPVTNLSTAGTNNLSGVIAYGRFNYSTVANGLNVGVPTGTNSVLYLSGNSSAFTTAGFAGDHTDGRFLIAINPTGQSWTVTENGTDPTAANRFRTGTGADVTITSNPGVATFLYDGVNSRWIMLSHN